MIAVDTSALMAILLEEEPASACRWVLRRERARIMSAVTLTEALVVARRRGLGDSMLRLIASLAPTVEPVTIESAYAAAAAYDLWGKGVHKAKLNLGDFFAYALARENGCPALRRRRLRADGRGERASGAAPAVIPA